MIIASMQIGSAETGRVVRLDEVPQAPTLENIRELEARMKAMPCPLDLPVVHHLADGIYGRELFIPKGTLLAGKLHHTDHINVVSKGVIEVWTTEGRKIIRAPATFIAKAGTKRVGLAHEDTVWTTFHPNPTNEHDLVKLEDLLIVKEKIEPERQLCHSQQ